MREKFEDFLKKVKANDKTLTKINVGINDKNDPNFISLDNIQELQLFAVAMAKNTFITEIENLHFYSRNLSKYGQYTPEAQLYIDFINIIIKQNSKIKTLNILEDRVENHFYYLENLGKNLDKFCLTPIATGAYLFREFLGYTLGFEWVFDLKRRPGPRMQGENGVPNAFPVPSIRILPSWRPIGKNFFKDVPFYYPKHAVSVWLPVHYLLIHLGHLIGAIVGLPVAIAALPIAFIKAGVAAFRKKKTDHLEIDNLKNQLSLDSNEPIRTAVKLITVDNMDQVWDLYQNLKGRLIEDYFQDIKEAFIESLGKIESSTDPNVSSVLSKIESDHPHEKAQGEFNKIDNGNSEVVGDYPDSPATMNKTPETPTTPTVKDQPPGLNKET